jgi:hypothetical protein
MDVLLHRLDWCMTRPCRRFPIRLIRNGPIEGPWVRDLDNAFQLQLPQLTSASITHITKRGRRDSKSVPQISVHKRSSASANEADSKHQPQPPRIVTCDLQKLAYPCLHHAPCLVLWPCIADFTLQLSDYCTTGRQPCLTRFES